jgi:hypothetical protein
LFFYPTLANYFPHHSKTAPTQLVGSCLSIGSAPTQQGVAASFDLGDVARAIERYLPNNTGGSKAKPRKRA